MDAYAILVLHRCMNVVRYLYCANTIVLMESEVDVLFSLFILKRHDDSTGAVSRFQLVGP